MLWRLRPLPVPVQLLGAVAATVADYAVNVSLVTLYMSTKLGAKPARRSFAK